MSPRDRIVAWIENDREELVRFLSGFVAVPSPNPQGDTRQAAKFLGRSHLDRRALPTQAIG